MNREQHLELMAALTRAPAPVPPPNITVNAPPIELKPEVHVDMSKFKLPEQPAPIVNVAGAVNQIEVRAAEQPSPVVTVNVSPTPVTISNTVEVPTASSITINRDSDGKMTGAEVARE